MKDEKSQTATDRPESPKEVMKELRRTSRVLQTLAQTHMRSTTAEYLSLAKNIGNIYQIVLMYDCEIEKATKAICGEEDDDISILFPYGDNHLTTDMSHLIEVLPRIKDNGVVEFMIDGEWYTAKRKGGNK